MTDGQVVRFQNGGTAQVKRVVINGTGGYQSLLVAVELPKAASQPKPASQS